MTERQAVTEFLTPWGLKGLEKGFKQGRKKMLHALRALIEGRFGPMPADDLSAAVRLALRELERMTLIAGTAT